MKRHPALLDRQRTALAIIDMQEAFRVPIADFSEVASRIAIMAEACKILSVPMIVTEQYPKGLGHTATEITLQLPEDLEPIEKLAFSACGAREFDTRLRERHIEQVMVCGIEAHICVSQTTHDLLQLGYQVHLLSDAITARSPHNREVGLNKMVRAGAIGSSIEMALFEMLRSSEASEFKAIQKLIK
jgi:nicotinamidase-related amidase